MTGLVRRELSDAGRTVLSTRHGAVVHYEADTSDLDNSDLVGLLQLLARLGVGFARDYTQMWSPADVVAELIDRGTEFSNPWACGFDGQVWHVKPYPWSGA